MTSPQVPAPIEIIEKRNLRLALHEYMFSIAARLLNPAFGGVEETPQLFKLSIDGIEDTGRVLDVVPGVGRDPLKGMVATIEVCLDFSELNQSFLPSGYDRQNDRPVCFTIRVVSCFAPPIGTRDEIEVEIENNLLFEAPISFYT